MEGVFKGDPTAVQDEWDKSMGTYGGEIDLCKARLKALYDTNYLKEDGTIDLSIKKVMDYDVKMYSMRLLKWQQAKDKLLLDRFALDREKISASEFIQVMIQVIIKVTMPFIPKSKRDKWVRVLHEEVTGKTTEELREYLKD